MPSLCYDLGKHVRGTVVWHILRFDHVYFRLGRTFCKPLHGHSSCEFPTHSLNNPLRFGPHLVKAPKG